MNLPSVPTCLYRDVFPWLSPDWELGHVPLPADPGDINVSKLVKIFSEECSTARYGTSLPGLHAIRNIKIPKYRLATRTDGMLYRSGITTWGDLLMVRPCDLQQMANVGSTSLADLAELCIHTAAEPFIELLDNQPRAESTIESSIAEIVDGLAQLDATIGELVPELVRRPYETVPINLLPVRLRTRLDPGSWQGLMGTSIRALLEMPNVGALSIRELLARLRREARREFVAPADSTPPFPAVPEFIDNLVQICTWANQQRDVSVLADAIVIEDKLLPLPPRLSQIWQRTKDVSIADLPADPLNHRFKQIVEELEPRELRIMQGRDWNLERPIDTLCELGHELGITRERVRQVEAKTRSTVTQGLHRTEYHALRDRSEELRRRLGTALPFDSGHLERTMTWCVEDIDSNLRPLARKFFLWAAGPYKISDEWLTLTKQGPDPKGSELRDKAGPSGYLPSDSAHSILDELGIIEDAHTAWLARVGLTPVDDGWLDLSGINSIEPAVRYLTYRQTPMTVEEILEGIGRTDLSLRSVRQRLFDDDRVVRVSRETVGLRSWGDAEYTSVADAMEQAIVANGGQIPLDRLVEALVDRFDISPTSIRMYVARPMFYIDEHRVVSLRTEANPYLVSRDLGSVPACYRLSPSEVAWRVCVDHDVLRGSGRHIPEPLADSLGLTPGAQSTLDTYLQPLRLSWRPWGQPDVGSLKPLADDLEAVEGDWIVLVFTGAKSASIRLLRHDDRYTGGLDFATGMMGLTSSDAGSTAIISRMCEVLGITVPDDDSARFRIRAAIEQRSDIDLLAIVDQLWFS